MNQPCELKNKRKVNMKSIAVRAFMGTLCLSAFPICAAEPMTVANMPPSVVSTSPAAGQMNVDPSTSEIRVTFSKNMMTNRMWAVCQVSKETYPQRSGDIHYLEDNRTCVVPVKLEPGKTYILWFNQGKFNSFRDTENHPAVPYLLVFQTR